MNIQEHTFCRICEPFCPLLADLDSHGKVVGLSPDVGHPSGSIACHKGLSFLDVHNDPDRISWPQRRLNPRSEARGDFVEADWETALADVGGRLRSILERYGPNAIAGYQGNPMGFDAAGTLSYGPFLDAVGTNMRFGAGTQDVLNKIAASALIYGSNNSLMMPDLYETDYLLCIGANPKISKWTFSSVPNDSMNTVKKIRQRGGKVRFVNPRRIESSTPETGPTLLIRPGADVYFLAAVLNELERLGGFNEDLLARYGKNVAGLQAFVRRYPAERVASIVGIDVAAIKGVARELCDAKSAVVYMSTGVNQSRQGMLAFWLGEMINFATGNLGRRGGAFKPVGLVDDCPPNRPGQVLTTSLGPFELPDPIGYMTLPAAVLPELIESGEVRALILWSGNPLLSVGGEDRMRRAFGKLDLLVSIDIFRNASGELCDYVLPATDWLERKDINLISSGMQLIPYVQYTDAIECAAPGRRDAAWILARLAQEIGVASILDHQPDQTDVSTGLLNQVLTARGLTIEQLRKEPWQTVTFSQAERDELYGRCLQHPDKRIDCCPASFERSGLFARCEAIFAELLQEPNDVLKLISLRTTFMHNSGLANLTKFRRGRQAVNTLHMCEQDAALRGLYEGDEVHVCTSHGELETRITIDDDLRPGVVAMSHGYGHDRAFGLRTAARDPGANCNRLMPMGAGTFEPISHMSWISGVPVTVTKSAQGIHK